MKLVRNATPLLMVLMITLLAYSCSDTPIGPGPDGSDNGSEDGDQTEPYSHIMNPGASANDFLADSNYTELTVEVDYMQGYEPDSDALSSLETFFEERLNKTRVTILEPTQISASGQDSYTASEIRSLEDQHRDHYTEGETLSAYMIIVDGEYQDENVLGIAYYNTSSAFFGAAYEQISGGIGQPTRYKTEATSFRHEFGHLFGLVGIEESDTEMQQDHQDSAHGHHCDNDSCLMYYAMESTDLFGSTFGDNIPSLDQNCLDDLQGNGGR